LLNYSNWPGGAGRLQAVGVTRCPLTGTVVAVLVEPGQEVAPGAGVVIVESMKMEHVVEATAGGVVARLAVGPGDQVSAGDVLIEVDPPGSGERTDLSPPPAPATEPTGTPRADLAALVRRRQLTHDRARPQAVQRRHRAGHRTARRNIEDLCDPGTFTEYGALAVAAQRSRRSLDDLIAHTPADGLVGGLGHINGDAFPPDRSRCAVLSYDYTVLAGTQGYQGHRKKDRLFELCERLRLPVVLFAEGGGGRPGDTDVPGVSGLDCMAFYLFGRLSGLVPLVGVVAGRCFAGNAALLACCDVIIATADSNIGMAGPAMVEGGGLGAVSAEAIGPMDVQAANGVVDVVVADDAAAVAAARRYLSYFQGPLSTWSAASQEGLRQAVPANRVRPYQVRPVLQTVADEGSLMELRSGWGPGMVTALARIEGRPVGMVANNPMHLGGAIDAEGADKAARFLALCDAHDLPVVSFCDTPGFMVGPDAERTGQVRHFGRLFVVGANLDVPLFTVVLRKGYGLGAQAMAGGSFRAPVFTVSWPTGEFGGMGLEGAVRLGFRRELEAVADAGEREQLYRQLVERSYERGRALNVATYQEIDDVIDPAETRARLAAGLGACPRPPGRPGKKRAWVDTW
jgi:acetyl-CoA carboxylase carboxyltransferase component